MAVVLPNGKQQFFTATGAPAAGWKLYAYIPGTTTPKDTYTDTGELTQNPHPVVMDSRGEAAVYWSGDYDVVLKDSADVTIWGPERLNEPETAGIADTLRADLALANSATKGAGLVGFAGTLEYPAGTIGSMLSMKSSPMLYEAVGDGVADDTSEVQTALNASLYVDLGGPSRSYKISGPLTLRSGHVIVGGGATITQTLAQVAPGDAVEIFNVTSKSDIDISGINFVGVGTDYLDSDASRACAVYGATAQTRVHVHNCRFTGFCYTNARFIAASACSFVDNIAVGPGSPELTAITSGKNYGVLFDVGSTDCKISGNSISKHAQGVRVEDVDDMRIESNRIFDITGQHGIYAGSAMRNLVIADNIIYDTDLQGIKVQATDAVDSYNVTITGNVVHTTGDQGILLTNGTAGAGRIFNATIVGNAVYAAVGTGINVQHTKNAVVSGNTIQLATYSGVNLKTVDNVRVSENVIKSSGLSAIRDEAACTYVTIANNTISDCATSATANDKYGIYSATAGTDWTIAGNVISDANAKMQYGIFINAGTLSTFTVQNNIVNQAVDYGLRIGTPAAFRSMQNNIWNGTAGVAFSDQVLPTMTPAATTSVVPFGTDVVLVAASATAMTTIPATGHAGRTVRFVCVGVSTFTDGGNLRLAGNFVSTADDVLTLACDGSTWYEVARSVN